MIYTMVDANAGWTSNLSFLPSLFFLSARISGRLHLLGYSPSQATTYAELAATLSQRGHGLTRSDCFTCVTHVLIKRPLSPVVLMESNHPVKTRCSQSEIFLSSNLLIAMPQNAAASDGG